MGKKHHVSEELMVAGGFSIETGFWVVKGLMF